MQNHCSGLELSQCVSPCGRCMIAPDVSAFGTKSFLASLCIRFIFMLWKAIDRIQFHSCMATEKKKNMQEAKIHQTNFLLYYRFVFSQSSCFLAQSPLIWLVRSRMNRIHGQTKILNSVVSVLL